MRSLTGSALLLLVLTQVLQTQDIPNLWQTEFPITGVEQWVYAMAIEGESVAVLTRVGVRVMREGSWGNPVALPNGDRFLGERVAWPVRNIALYRGDVWIAGDSTIYRLADSGWQQVVRPIGTHYSGGPVAKSAEFAVVEDDLYVTPSLHRWTGSTWESAGPGGMDEIWDVAASASGRWLLVGAASRGSNSARLALFEDGTLSYLPNPPGITHFYGMRFAGISFDGEFPLIAGHRFENGEWVELDVGELVEQSAVMSLYQSRAIFPIVAASNAHAIFPGMNRPAGPGEEALPSCGDDLKKLVEGRWTSQSGVFDSPLSSLVSWHDSGVGVGGGFTTDGRSVVAAGVAGYDGDNWFSFGVDRGTRQGIAGRLSAVSFLRDDLYVGGRSLLIDGDTTTAPILRYRHWDWERVPLIEGVVNHLEDHQGALYVAGNLSTGTSPALKLARYQDTTWTELLGVQDEVTLLESHGTALYVATLDSTDSENPRSRLLLIENDSIEVLVEDYRGDIRAIGISRLGTFLGGSSGALSHLMNGTLTEVTVAKGDRWELIDSLPVRKHGPSIDALWYNGSWLWVGGSFDSIGGIVASSIAAYRDGSWVSVDSGMLRSDYYTTQYGCTMPVVDRVSSIGVHNYTLFVAGAFRRIGTQGPESICGGEEVLTPVAIRSGNNQWSPGSNEGRAMSMGYSFTPVVRDMDFDEGRMAMVGDFLLEGRSRNVALTQLILSVEEEDSDDASIQPPFTLRFTSGSLQLETSEPLTMTIESFDLSGRRLELIYDGAADVGTTDLKLVEIGPLVAKIVVARDQFGRQVELKIVR